MALLRLLLLPTAITTGFAQINEVSYVDSGIAFTGVQELGNNVTYAFALPPLNTTTNRGEFIGQIIAPLAGVAFGGAISLGVIGFPNDTQILGSPRFVGPILNVAATPFTDANVSTIASTINATHWNWIYRCENRTAWAGGSFAVNGTQNIAWLIGHLEIPPPVAENSTLSALQADGIWPQNLAIAHDADYANFVGVWTRKPDV
ncbi:hypothetical protein B0H19DRAFT_1076974 [Mycena capillaripes]|nr:hypothetical protein B0H19DRAFT_1076974 [Mycena capillaripes]